MQVFHLNIMPMAHYDAISLVINPSCYLPRGNIRHARLNLPAEDNPSHGNYVFNQVYTYSLIIKSNG